MKRRIIDVLKNDGIDLAHQQNERLSSLTTSTNITPLKRFKPAENSTKLNPSNANEPSTSYSASSMTINGNFLKHNNQMKNNNDILSDGGLQRTSKNANFTHRQALNRTRMEVINSLFRINNNINN